MRVERFVSLLKSEFFTGVPDSRLRPLCDYLAAEYGFAGHHIIGANEGSCVAMAAGYYLAAGRPAVVYLQNSGIGNIINPVTSLTSTSVYGIPCLYVVGWRGEPGSHDEPQHALMGRITLRLLQAVELDTFVVGPETTEALLETVLDAWRIRQDGSSFVLVVRDGALDTKEKQTYYNDSLLLRETAIKQIIKSAGKDILIATTGKTSRELFEFRVRQKQPHGRDFLTVGSMGHSSSIALTVALEKRPRRVWCLDGDGATVMHMGALATIGVQSPTNLVHVIFNNSAYESVGGMPTAAGKIDLCGVALACGYRFAERVQTAAELKLSLSRVVARSGPQLLEIRTAIGSRSDLGRPAISLKIAKAAFMDYLEHSNC